MMGLGGARRESKRSCDRAEVADESNRMVPLGLCGSAAFQFLQRSLLWKPSLALYGKIESTRVLTHKNCGFVNFDRLESAVQAKSLLNGKEIFPGAGPVRIGYAKVPGASASGTPGANGIQSSPTPDPHTALGSKHGAIDADQNQTELAHILHGFLPLAT